ncbi:alpha/beta-hydrolase [Viridothelium virens]|uniref:Alpha/beta-hydrolase n=1 Tax=Viridothelium virens TaxID=1048519 RepID=A0A6A6HHQ5_VIRVR|nr:alpha/beta-hydrolase [Viridothelium virens]
MPCRLPASAFHPSRLTPRLNRIPLPLISHHLSPVHRSLSTAIGQTALDAGQDASAHQTVTLLDGRTLGFAAYGARTGPALFHFHSLASSRLEAASWDAAAQRLGARVIGVDRPGIGLSTFYPRRKLSQWPLDVTQLADHLGIERFRVVGVEAGAPYALACAQYLPREQLRGVGVLAGMGPFDWRTMRQMRAVNRIAWNAAALSSGLMRLWLDAYLGRMARDPDPAVLHEALRKRLGSLPRGGQEMFEEEEALFTVVEALRESFREGTEGIAEDVRLMTSSWKFTLEEVEFPGVRLWYGTDDHRMPVGIGRGMARRLPNAKLTEYQGASQFGIGIDHTEEVIRDILKDE